MAHGQNSRALGDIGKRDHRPKHGATIVRNELQVDCIGHVVQACYDERRIEETKYRAKDDTRRARDARIHNSRDARTEPPANWAEHEVSSNDREHEAAEWHNDHRYHLGADLAEESLKVAKRKGCQDGRDDLRLIANHVDLEIAEVPDGDLIGRRCRDAVGVEQLA